MPERLRGREVGGGIVRAAVRSGADSGAERPEGAGAEELMVIGRVWVSVAAA